MPILDFRNSLSIAVLAISDQYATLIISQNEVFGDIMVLASPPPRPPVDPDDANTQPISFKFYMRVDAPLMYFAKLIPSDESWLEQLCSQPNDTRIPQIFKMQYLHK